MNKRKNKGSAKSAANPTPASKATPTPPAKATPTPPPAPAAKATPAPAPKPAPEPPKPQVKPQAKPAAPPPPPPAAPLSPSAKLRREWKLFEIWLREHRDERDKRLKELRSKTARVMSFHRGANAKPNPALVSEEIQMNEDLAKKARVEWERRLKAGALNEEDWTDITEKEMEAVEAAFVPAPLSDDPQVDFNAGDDSRYSMDGSTLSGSPPEPTFEFDPKKAFPPRSMPDSQPIPLDLTQIIRFHLVSPMDELSR